MLPETTVEAITEFTHILLKILTAYAMKSSIQKSFQIADHDMDQWQPVSSFLWWSHSLFMSMVLGYGIQSRKCIRSYLLSRLNVAMKKVTHTVLGDFAYHLGCQEPCMLFSSFYRNVDRFLSGSASATLACFFPPTKVSSHSIRFSRR